MRVVTRLSSTNAGNCPILRVTPRFATMRPMADGQKINVAKLKRDIIAFTGEGGRMTRRKLSLAASNDRNPDLVRDLINRKQGKQITSETLVGLATAMDRDPADYYDGVEATRSPPLTSMEVIGEVRAGNWTEHPEWPEDDRYSVNVDPSDFPEVRRFGLVMRGLSMEKRIPDGALLECLEVFDSSGMIPQDGDVVIVRWRRELLFETTCKTLRIARDGTYSLHCESDRPEFREPVFVGKPDPDGVIDDDARIIAVVERATLRFLRKAG